MRNKMAVQQILETLHTVASQSVELDEALDAKGCDISHILSHWQSKALYSFRLLMDYLELRASLSVKTAIKDGFYLVALQRDKMTRKAWNKVSPSQLFNTILFEVEAALIRNLAKREVKALQMLLYYEFEGESVQLGKRLGTPIHW